MEMIDQVESQMITLKLHGMRESYGRRCKQAGDEGLAHEDCVGMLVQDEVEHRKNTRIQRLLKNAAFRQPASVEGVDFATPRGLDKKQIAGLAGGRFIRDGLNIVILGPTGVGKSFLASAIGNAACRSGYSTLFYRMNALIEQMALARAKGTYLNLLRRLSSSDLLILDDFGIKPLSPQQYQDLYDALDERGETKSTIITSQLPIANWNEVIADPVTCEAVTDRIASRAVVLQMKGDSYRRRRGAGSVQKLDKD
jgi:DNA replication protein DnaC